jgi:hypothetical protein
MSDSVEHKQPLLLADRKRSYHTLYALTFA